MVEYKLNNQFGYTKIHSHANSSIIFRKKLKHAEPHE